jgi:hypothetical protein
VSSLSGGRGINLLQELAAVLRRALTQQAPVREALYNGLLQVRRHCYVLPLLLLLLLLLVVVCPPQSITELAQAIGSQPRQSCEVQGSSNKTCL